MDYEKAYKDLMRDIDIAIEGQNDGETKVVLQNIKERNIESYDERIRKEIIEFLTDGIWSVKEIGKVRETQKYAKWIAYLEKQKKQTTKTDACGFLRDKGQLGCMKKEDVLNDMLKATTEEQKQRVLEIFDIKNETCCHFPCDTESEDYSEFDDRVYLDGDITFDKMAAVVDYLRACNPEKEVNRLEEGRKSLRPRLHWEPSEEQMRCLLDCVSKAKEIHNASVGGYDAYRILVSLYDDLHKLL